MKRDDDHTYTLTLTVHNQPGLLVRCAQVFGRRGHNIEALQVAPEPNREGVSIMTITAFGKPHMMDQIMGQLSKLIDVITISKEEA